MRTLFINRYYKDSFFLHYTRGVPMGIFFYPLVLAFPMARLFPLTFIHSYNRRSIAAALHLIKLCLSSTIIFLYSYLSYRIAFMEWTYDVATSGVYSHFSICNNYPCSRFLFVFRRSRFSYNLVFFSPTFP